MTCRTTEYLNARQVKHRSEKEKEKIRGKCETELTFCSHVNKSIVSAIYFIFMIGDVRISMYRMTVKIHVEPIIDKECWRGVCNITRVLLKVDARSCNVNHIIAGDERYELEKEVNITCILLSELSKGHSAILEAQHLCIVSITVASFTYTKNTIAIID